MMSCTVDLVELKIALTKEQSVEDVSCTFLAAVRR